MFKHLMDQLVLGCAMSGKFHCFTVRDIIQSIATNTTDHYWDTVYTYRVYPKSILESKLSGKTGILIFSRYQLDYLNTLSECQYINILFQSKKCVNPEHPENGPSNTVVIFEVKQ